jgi:alpha-amylase
MSAYLDRIDRKFSLMDVELVDRLSAASRTEQADLAGILSNTLVSTRPIAAVTFVENHDTQDGQALGPPVLPWFKPLAYALVLLRQGGYPCVFYGDLYGVSGPPGSEAGPSCGGQLGDFILARKLYGYGNEVSYFDFRTCVGWVRQGTWDHVDGCAVVMSNAGAGWKNMNVGTLHVGEVWTDVVCPSGVFGGWYVGLTGGGSLGGVIGRLRLGMMGMESFIVMRLQ